VDLTKSGFFNMDRSALKLMCT